MKADHQWFLKELPGWVSEGLVSAESAETLRARYAASTGGLSWAFVVFGVLGALSIGLGLIALMAANWDRLSPPLRLVNGCLPLLACGALAYWTQATRRLSPAWQEPLGIAWSLAIGLVISITAQIYQISGNAESFTLTWTLLLLPVLYVTQAVVPTVGYFAGLVNWACITYHTDTANMWYWALIMPALPQLWRKSKADNFSWHLTQWGVIAAMLLAVGMTLEKYNAGLWLVVYTGVFAVLTLFASPLNKERAVWTNPCNLVGYIGLAFMLWLTITGEWAWEELGTSRNSDDDYHAVRAIFDIVVTCGVLLAAAGGFAYKVIIRRQFFYIIPGLSVFLVTAFWCLLTFRENGSEPITLAIWSLSLYLIIYGMLFIIDGFKSRSLRLVNGGTIVLTAVILTRFFADSASLTMKGVVLILTGVFFLYTNITLKRRFK